MITLEEAVTIANELKEFRDSSPIRGNAGWRVDKRTKDMMDYYNSHRKELTPAGYTVALLPMSMNCNPCIGKVVHTLLSLKTEAI